MTDQLDVGELVSVADPDQFVAAFARRIAGRIGAVDGVIGGTRMNPGPLRYKVRFPAAGRKPEFLTGFNFRAKDLIAAATAQPGGRDR